MEAIQDKIKRMIDANFNRTREGLRVIEDIARFVLGNKDTTDEMKLLRSDLAKIEKNFDFTLSRDTENDVGTSLSSDIEERRGSVFDIFKANIKRIEESLRVLEETFKTIDIEMSKKLKSMRYKIYIIERKFEMELKEIDGQKQN